MTDQLLEGIEESLSIGMPLQDQVEQVEDALGKALDVIEALTAERNDLHAQLYQAQLDAQDWQNRALSSSTQADRIVELTRLNTELELRNERQAEMISRARWNLTQN